MATEVEKKLRLTAAQEKTLRSRLGELNAVRGHKELEHNTIYSGHDLDPARRVLRLRRTPRRATLTFKERFPSSSAIKHQREEETGVEDPEVLAAIVTALGFKPALIYEKRRETWKMPKVEVMIDELPFGLFVEIEGEESAIVEAEGLLDLAGVEAEMKSYPELVVIFGVKREEVIEARFKDSNKA